MKPYCLLLAVLCMGTSLWAQKIYWRPVQIDQDLEVNLPVNYLKLDTTITSDNTAMRMLIYKAAVGAFSFGATVTPQETKSNIDNPEDLQKYYRGYEEGFKKSAVQHGYACTSADTTIGTQKGRIETVYITRGVLKYISKNYTFLVNDKLYILTIAFADTAGNSAMFNHRFIANAHFLASATKEQKFGSIAESQGYKIGRLFFPLLIVAGILLAIVFAVRRKRG